MRRRNAGFTLAEVLVALAVLAIGLSAALTAAGQVSRIAGDLRQRTLAHWVAQNEITRMRLDTRPASTGRTEGEVDMGGVTWHWDAAVFGTTVAGLKRISIMVSLSSEPEAIVVTETGFVGIPRPGYASSPWESPAELEGDGTSAGDGQ